MTTVPTNGSHGTQLARKVAVGVLTATIIALGTAVIVHGRDLVELRTRVHALEQQIERLTK